MKNQENAQSGGLFIPDDKLIAARDWLNAGPWMEFGGTAVDPRGCPEQIRAIENTIALHYDGGVAGFLEDHA